MAQSPSSPNLVNQTMPNMSNNLGSDSGAFPSWFGITSRKICGEYLHGRCANSSCKWLHPTIEDSMVDKVAAADTVLAAQRIVAAQDFQSAKQHPSAEEAALKELALLLSSKPISLQTPELQETIYQKALSMPRTVKMRDAILKQQTVTAQQTADRAATELAAAIAAEVRKNLLADGLVIVEKEPDKKARSPSPTRAKSRTRRSREYRSRSPVRSRHYSRERRSYRDTSDKRRSRDLGRSHGHRDDLGSPSHRLESHTERTRNLRSPLRHVTKSSSSSGDGSKSRRRGRSLSKSDEVARKRESKRR